MSDVTRFAPFALDPVERYSRTFSRSLSLGGEVDEANAKAECKHGVLSLGLPKKAPGDHKRLTALK